MTTTPTPDDEPVTPELTPEAIGVQIIAHHDRLEQLNADADALVIERKLLDDRAGALIAEARQINKQLATLTYPTHIEALLLGAGIDIGPRPS